MSLILWRSSLRYLVQHPWQVGLSILGVALGVARFTRAITQGACQIVDNALRCTYCANTP